MQGVTKRFFLESFRNVLLNLYFFVELNFSKKLFKLLDLKRFKTLNEPQTKITLFFRSSFHSVSIKTF